MSFIITRTVNGIPVSDEEAPAITLMNEEMRYIVRQVLSERKIKKERRAHK